MTITARDLAGLKPLRESNDCLDDPEALDRRWSEDGYLYFRDILDKSDLAEVRRTYLDALVELGAIDADAEEPVWNGTDVTHFPFKLEGLIKSRVYERLASRSSFLDLATRVLGDAPYFLPMTEYRADPPHAESADTDVMYFRHQDGLNNYGIPFRIFWVPVFDMDARRGGIVMAEGWNHRGFVHDPEDRPHFGIADNTVPDADWRRSDYRAGDVLVFDIMTPHSGFANVSNQFRCSLDIRAMRASDESRPIIGSISAVAPDRLSILSDDGGIHSLIINGESKVRGKDRNPISSREAIAEEVPIGMRVIASHVKGVLQVLRDER